MASNEGIDGSLYNDTSQSAKITVYGKVTTSFLKLFYSILHNGDAFASVRMLVLLFMYRSSPYP